MRLFRNRPFALLWSGQTVSTIGDAFFNIAVVWVIYTESGSAFQTALVQVVWQLAPILVGPFAGALADQYDRKRTMVIGNALAAVVVGFVAAVMVLTGHAPASVVLVAILLLNGLTTFVGPARFSLMPEIVGRDLIATAGGLFSTAGQVGSLIGSALAGVVIATVGAAWAVAGDAVSFVVAAFAIAAAVLPKRKVTIAKGPSLPRQIADGWRAIADRPVVRTLVWLSVLINVSSFLGPLYPALVRLQLGSDASGYGSLLIVPTLHG